AARAAERLGLPHNAPGAVARTRDKAAMRAAFAEHEVSQPRFVTIEDPDEAVAAATTVGFPVVVKPVGLSGSRGVIRADDATGATEAAHRAAAISDDRRLVVEQLLDGPEISVEGLLRGGRLDVLAVFDKPDAPVGPFFEETIYVTPPRSLPGAALDAVPRIVADAAAAIGLSEGPIHAELRAGSDGRLYVLEVAARSIGGLCARALRFGAGISLEEVILRHALGMALDGITREPDASGVMMLPITRAGTLVAVRGQERARAVPGIVGLEITIPPGRPLVPLPEGDRYLGFLFARGERPADVEHALRAAHRELEIDVA
ncbi:MAG TPA: ATP-grasp domain-containing protein, partial [Acidimicrobiia bacterium]